MADNVAITAGSGTTIAADDVSSVYFQKIKVDIGGDGVSVPLVAGQQAMAASLPIVVASNQTAIPVSDGSSTLSIDDGAGSITVDGTVAITGSVAVTDGSGSLSVDDGGGSLTVDGTVGVSGTVTVDSELPAAAALADATANPTVPTVGAANLLFNGATWDRAKGDTANGLDVDVTRVTGTVTVDSELPAAAALADAAANPTTPTAGSATLLYNGTTWDRARGDTSNGLDVDVTRVSGTVAVSVAAGAATIAKAEDVASADADVGVPAMAVRKATPANTSGTDGDYEMLQMSAGRLWTSATVDAALPAGTNAIGKLAANAGVNIGTVDVASITAGETHVGEVGAAGTLLDATLTLDTSAYADGDVMADTQSLSSAVRVNAGRAVLQSITVIDEDDQGQTFDIIFLDSNNSLGTENAAPSISDANARTILGRVRIDSSDYIDLGGVRIANRNGIGLLLKAAAASTTLYVGTIIRGAATYTASGVRLRIGLLWD